MRCSGYRKHCTNYTPYSDEEDICAYLDDWDNPEWDNCCNPPKMDKEEIEFQIEELEQLQRSMMEMSISFGNALHYLKEALK